MKNVSRLLVLTLLLAGLAFLGCGNPEPTPSPTPTPPPKPSATGNKDCKGTDTCKLTTDEVAAESGMSGHACDGFDELTAIRITKGNAASGKFKKIHIKKENTSPTQFTIAVTACPGFTGNPFPHANKPDKDNWDSGDLDPSVADASHYRLVMTETKGKGKGKGAKQSDPHIIIDGGKIQ